MTGAPQEDKDPGTATSLLEREAELELISSLLDQTAAGSGGAAISAAPAGIGKTKLLEAAVEDAPAVGARALVARATEIERGFAFGVVRQLLEPAVVEASEEQRVELFAEPPVPGAAALDSSPSARPIVTFTRRCTGLLLAARRPRARSPLLVAVDDLSMGG